jgi:hypothetical protein
MPRDRAACLNFRQVAFTKKPTVAQSFPVDFATVGFSINGFSASPVRRAA